MTAGGGGRTAAAPDPAPAAGAALAAVVVVLRGAPAAECVWIASAGGYKKRSETIPSTSFSSWKWGAMRPYSANHSCCVEMIGGAGAEEDDEGEEEDDDEWLVVTLRAARGRCIKYSWRRAPIERPKSSDSSSEHACASAPTRRWRCAAFGPGGRSCGAPSPPSAAAGSKASASSSLASSDAPLPSLPPPAAARRISSRRAPVGSKTSS